MTSQKAPSPAPHMRAAQDFYAGMVQAGHDAETQFIPQAKAEFTRREAGRFVDQAFSKKLAFSKVMHQAVSGVPRAPVPHTFSLFALEYFACVSALNLYRLPDSVEQFKAEIFSEAYLQCCASEEKEWLGIYGADTPLFKQETGYDMGQWRGEVICIYLRALNHKSSRDADTLVAITRLLERMDLSKARGLPVTPVLLEQLAQYLEAPAGWLTRYLKFRPF